MEAPFEYRQYARFQVPGVSAYAVFRRQWPRSPVVGEIIDVGSGGLSFCYTASRKGVSRPSGLDILLTDGSFSLNNVPLRIITDIELETEESSGFATRRCGVQFGDLTDEQKSNLLYFIQTYTTADPEA
jgi:hypothetical protein